MDKFLVFKIIIGVLVIISLIVQNIILIKSIFIDKQNVTSKDLAISAMMNIMYILYFKFIE